jgi:site-specific recombinase XerD
MRDFFSLHIRNPNTRRAYREAVRQFSSFCAEHGIMDLAQVEPVHVAAFVEAQLKQNSKPTVKQRLAAQRMLFDWMVVVGLREATEAKRETRRRRVTPMPRALGGTVSAAPVFIQAARLQQESTQKAEAGTKEEGAVEMPVTVKLLTQRWVQGLVS